MYRRLISMLLLLILLDPLESNASFRKLAEDDVPNGVKPVQISPSPSPVSSINTNSGSETFKDGQVPANSPKLGPIGVVVNETCEMTTNRWCRDRMNMIACLPHSTSGPQGSFLLVQNDGENSLKVKVKFVPTNHSYEEIEILKQQAQKINVSADVEGSSSIVLNAGNGDCIIHMVTPAPVQQGNFFDQFPPYATYATPINGAYLLFLTALIIGGTLACCKLGKRRLHLDGVPYQELEMGQPDSLSSMNVETAEVWDQGWNDVSDEEKAVKSPGVNHVGNGLANGLTTRSSKTEGWGNDWDD